MQRTVDWLDRHQVTLYLAALLVGGVVGMGVPDVAGPAETSINPVLVLLLYATFLGVPFAGIVRALRDWRFLATVGVLNFVVVPVVVWLVSRLVADDEVLLVGVLFVLLAPCIDYVIVFTGLAGGAADRLLAAAPLLMLAQMALLPVFLWLFVGSGVVDSVEMGPFIEAFLVLIVLPLVAAGLTQWASSRAGAVGFAGRALEGFMAAAMVPLMMLTLAVVVASQIHGVSEQWEALLRVVPVYVVFAVVMTALGWAAGRAAGLDVPGRRAVLFTGVTRNSLVVLPLVLALPAAYALAPLVVVTQTLVELIAMVVLVRVVPRLVR
ncbi:MAG: bile acid:sodium symporter [Mycobacteriaceae bacterium]|uniref:bile acid:sodium symporter n=1 Tax=Corynebacterium sp. TaxID=1720 RepID=UPI003F9A0719